MAAFDKIFSGFPQMDEILDHIRLGDNVVWQISDLEEFRMFAEPFARQAVADGRNVIYIRFAQHEPVLRDLTGIQVRQFDPDAGFEAFTVAIHEEITRQGRDAFYVFDCLSELQSVWYTDLMMGNFFRVTCPYLFELDTVAYFPLIRGRHSFDAVARIRDTTQLLLDVYSNEKYVYLHPLKVWNRYSDKMFLPHAYRKTTGQFSTVSDGVGMSRYYQTLHEKNALSQDQNYDSYDRFFNMAKLEYARGHFDDDTEDQIIRSTMTKDKRLKELVKRYFQPRDYFALRTGWWEAAPSAARLAVCCWPGRSPRRRFRNFPCTTSPTTHSISALTFTTPTLSPMETGVCASASGQRKATSGPRKNCGSTF